MTDARMLEPLIGSLLRRIGRKPSRIVPGVPCLRCSFISMVPEPSFFC